MGADAFEIVSICPALVIGPAFVVGGGAFHSGNFLTKLMKGEMGGSAGSIRPLVEVHNVALAHFNAIKVPEAANKRFLLVNKALYENEMAQCLHGEFGGEWPDLHDGSNDSNPGPLKKFDRSRSESILQITYEPDICSVLRQMVHSMIETNTLI